MHYNPVNESQTSFIIVSHGHREHVYKLLESIKQYCCNCHEIVLIDNINLGEFCHEELSLFTNDYCKSVKLIKNHKIKSFSENNNLAIANASGESIFIINPDTQFLNSDIHEKYSSIPDNTVIYPSLVNSDMSEQIHYNAWPNVFKQFVNFVSLKLTKKRIFKARRDWYFAAAIMMKKTTFYKIGGFNEIFPLYCEDVEFYQRARLKGANILIDRDIVVMHDLGGDSKGKYFKYAVVSNVLWRIIKLINFVKYSNTK